LRALVLLVFDGFFKRDAGVLKYFCYKDSCPPVYTDWACSDANNKIINPDYTPPAAAAAAAAAACAPAPLAAHSLFLPEQRRGA
jgi:hypothetical protein